MWDVEDMIFGSIFAVITLFVLYTISFAVTTLIVDKRCLDAGYPESRVTYEYSGYCLNLEGDITVKVTEVK